MEIGQTPRIPAHVGAGDASRASPVADTPPVRTELPPEKAPTAPDTARDVPGERVPGAPDPTPTVDRRIEVDAETQALVFRAVDEATGEVVRQVPDQALLRLRAYARELRLDAARGPAGEPPLQIVA